MGIPRCVCVCMSVCSALGMFWSLLPSFVCVFVLFLVTKKKKKNPPFHIYSYVGQIDPRGKNLLQFLLKPHKLLESSQTFLVYTKFKCDNSPKVFHSNEHSVITKLKENEFRVRTTLGEGKEGSC